MLTMTPWSTYTDWPLPAAVLMAHLHHRLWAHSTKNATYDKDIDRRYAETLLTKWRETALAGTAFTMQPTSVKVAKDFFTKMEDARQSEEMAMQISKNEVKRHPEADVEEVQNILNCFEFMGVGDPWWTEPYVNWEEKLIRIKVGIDELERE